MRAAIDLTFGHPLRPEDIYRLSHEPDNYAAWVERATERPRAEVWSALPSALECRAHARALVQSLPSDWNRGPLEARVPIVLEAVRALPLHPKAPALALVAPSPQAPPEAAPRAPAPSRRTAADIRREQAERAPAPTPKPSARPTPARDSLARETAARLEAKARRRNKRKTGRGIPLPPEIGALAEHLPGTARAVLAVLWDWSTVQTVRLNAAGELHKSWMHEPAREVHARVWIGSINGLAATLRVSRRTVGRALKRLDERGAFLIHRLQRGRPAFTATNARQAGQTITPASRSTYTLHANARQVRKARAARREVCEGKRTRAGRRRER